MLYSYRKLIVLLCVLALYVMIIFIAASCTTRKYFVNPNPGNRLCVIPELVIGALTLPEEYDGYIQRSIDFWNERVGKEVFMNGGRAALIDNDDSVAFLAVRIADQERVIRWNKENDRTIGYNRKFYSTKRQQMDCIVGSAVWVKDTGDETEREIFLVLAHEMGHGLGLGHSDQEDSLMHKNIDGDDTALELGLDTVKELEDLYIEE